MPGAPRSPDAPGRTSSSSPAASRTTDTSATPCTNGRSAASPKAAGRGSSTTPRPPPGNPPTTPCVPWGIAGWRSSGTASTKASPTTKTSTSQTATKHSEEQPDPKVDRGCLTRAPDATASQDFQQVHERMAAYFDEEERLEIVGVVINMNVWTRLK